MNVVIIVKLFLNIHKEKRGELAEKLTRDTANRYNSIVAL